MLAASDEAGRLAALRQLRLLDTSPSDEFDRLTLLATRCLATPMALITLIDAERAWAKSRHGLDQGDTPRAISFCDHTIRGDESLVVNDAREDPRFRDNPQVTGVPHIRFYAGAPLITRDGYAIGTICVLDRKPRAITAAERHTLEILAAQVMQLIELRHACGRLHPTSRLPNAVQFDEDLADLTRRHRGQSRLFVMLDIADPDHLPTHINLLGPRWERDLPAAMIRGIHAAFGEDLPIYHPLSLRFGFLLDPSVTPGWQEKLDQMAAHLHRPMSDAVPVALFPSVGVVPFRLGDFMDKALLQRGVLAAHEARAVGRVVTTARGHSATDDWHDAHMLLGNSAAPSRSLAS